MASQASRGGAWLALVFLLSPASAMTFTVVHRTPLDAARCKASGLSRAPFAVGLFKAAGPGGTLESAVVETPEPFDDLVGSWSADLPPKTRLEMQVQVRAAAGWSRWYALGAQEGAVYSSPDRQEDADGFVDIDTLRLARPATAWRYRFRFETAGRKAVLRQAAVAVSGPGGPEAPAPFRGEARELELRARSQMEEQEKYKHDICSPTSLAMVLEHWGARLPTVEVAERARDKTTALFGVWPANIALAASLGLEGAVARLDSLEDLAAEVARGRPVVVSVTFGPGELSGSPIKKTKGHLMTVIGFTEKGDVVALDPAAPDRKSARRVYDRAEFHKAWRLNKRGLAYLIGPRAGSPLGRRMTVGVPVADLQAGPRQRAKPVLDDADHLSQLLYGETVTVVGAEGDWAKVRADEQPDYFEGRKWQGYPGWVRADALLSAAPAKPDCVVRTRQALLQRGEEMTPLSVGTRLARVSESSGVAKVRLLDGGLGEIASDALYAPPSEPTEYSRSQIIKTAELFLGTSYYWGGRSGVQPDMSMGVDCSGLANLSYRIHGIDIPRDSHEQKLKARPIKRAELLPGDLVFLSDSETSRRITHVLIYTGGDGVIESRKSSGRVLRSSFTERFGTPLSAIESGAALTDLSFPKPRRRRIFFGSYF